MKMTFFSTQSLIFLIAIAHKTLVISDEIINGTKIIDKRSTFMKNKTKQKKETSTAPTEKIDFSKTMALNF